MNKKFLIINGILIIVMFSMGWKIQEETGPELSRVKVVSEYTSIGNGEFYLKRSVEEDIEILKELWTDWVYLGFRYQKPVPYSPEEEPGFFTQLEIKEAERRGYTFFQLKDAITKLKKEMPNVLFTAGLGLEFFYSKDRDPIIGEIIDAEKSWNMALDPQEYGFSITKEEFQCCWAKKGGIRFLPSDFDCSEYDYRKLRGYFPDINKKDVRELYLHKAMKLIDCGTDVIWIDMLHAQPIIFYKLGAKENSWQICKTLESISKLVEEIRNYGTSKGRRVYIGSWVPALGQVEFFEGKVIWPKCNILPNYDYVVVSPGSREIWNMKLNETIWENVFSEIKRKLGNITILMRLDLGAPNSPTQIFSQCLNKTQQEEFLRYLDNFLSKYNILFSYPVFGLYMGPWTEESYCKQKILSWQNICWQTLIGEKGCGFPLYDSLAPEFQTYETIKELALKKKSKKIISRR